MNLTLTATSTLVAQFFAAKKKTAVYEVIADSLWLSLFWSLIISVMCFLFKRPIFLYMGLDSETLVLATKFFDVFIYGLPIIYLFTLQGYIFNAYGDTKVSNLIMLFALTLNALLDPCFIFGYSIFPQMGIAGAKFASVLSILIGLILRQIYLNKKEYIGKSQTFLKFTGNYNKQIFKIGINSTLTNLVWCLVFPVLTATITQFGMEPLGGLNIGNRFEGFPYYFSVGFSIAISTLIAQSVGRGDIESILKIAIKGSILITVLLLPISLMFIFIPEHLISLLNSDPQIVKHGAMYLKIVGYFEILLGFEVLFEGAFNGLGETKLYMFLRVPLTLVRIPLASLFALTLGFGIQGVWWAISITTLIKGVGMAILFVKHLKTKSNDLSMVYVHSYSSVVD
ncbi:MAG: MATE family efflux transporter [Bacteriovoracaceae bacterium]|nr:MATE family efflux transporter [Bacteriovoracaceae bacterium]